MSHDVATREVYWPSAGDLETMKTLGGTLVKSGLLPVSIKTPEQAIAVLLKGRELGLPPMASFAAIAVIQGKPTISAEGMLALVRRAHPRAIISFLEASATRCVIEVIRQSGEKPTTVEFSMDDAKRAGLDTTSTWRKYPAAMLRARAISAMCRLVFPDALMGASYTPEEMGAVVNEEGEIIEEPRDPKPVMAEQIDLPGLVSPQQVELERREKETKDRTDHVSRLLKEYGLEPKTVIDWCKTYAAGLKVKDLSIPQYQELTAHLASSGFSSAPSGFIQSALGAVQGQEEEDHDARE